MDSLLNTAFQNMVESSTNLKHFRKFEPLRPRYQETKNVETRRPRNVKISNQETKKLRNQETEKPRNQENKNPRSHEPKKPKN